MNGTGNESKVIWLPPSCRRLKETHSFIPLLSYSAVNNYLNFTTTSIRTHTFTPSVKHRQFSRYSSGDNWVTFLTVLRPLSLAANASHPHQHPTGVDWAIYIDRRHTTTEYISSYNGKTVVMNLLEKVRKSANIDDHFIDEQVMAYGCFTFEYGPKTKPIVKIFPHLHISVIWVKSLEYLQSQYFTRTI